MICSAYVVFISGILYHIHSKSPLRMVSAASLCTDFPNWFRVLKLILKVTNLLHFKSI